MTLSAPAFWPLGGLAAGMSGITVSLPAGMALPSGAWAGAPTTAAVVPLPGQGTEPPIGALIVGLNPHRPFDDSYQGFIDLVAGQIAASLANATSFETDRLRAATLAEAARMRQEAAEALARANRHLAAEVEARTEERDRLRSLFQQAPGFMCVLRGPDHVFELVNDSYLQLVGHRALVGKPIALALPEVIDQGFGDLLDHVYRTATPYVGRSVVVMLQRTPGAALEERVVHFVYQPILRSDGSTSGIFAEGSDVTDQARAEQELTRLNETLEQRVLERTDELTEALERLRQESLEREAAEDALRQAQKMEAVGQLTGGIAHDFNNLLQGIVGSLDLMQKRITQGRIQDVDRFLTGAMTSANRAAALTHRLLAFSRRQPLDPKPVKANPLVASMEDLLRRTLGERVELELVLAGGLWTTLCDPNQLESAILNLAINARDAMPDGGRLTIETCNAHLDDLYASRLRDVRRGQYICICVTDTGTGMTPEVMQRAFDPFFTTKPAGQGTGLGLSMIYGFARQSEGYAKMYSEPAKGTTVKLYLPRHIGGEHAADDLNHADTRDDQATSGETILVIEDEPVVRALVTEVLEGLGYRSLEAADGPTGLGILQSGQRIDLVVTDIGLPGLNGRQVVDAARLTRPDLKVLFMTGYAENAAFAGGFLEHGMAMITKPFAIDTLAARISAIIKGE